MKSTASEGSNIDQDEPQLTSEAVTATTTNGPSSATVADKPTSATDQEEPELNLEATTTTPADKPASSADQEEPQLDSQAATRTTTALSLVTVAEKPTSDSEQDVSQLAPPTAKTTPANKPASGIRPFQLRADPQVLKRLGSASPKVEYLPKGKDHANDAASTTSQRNQKRRYFLPNGKVVTASMKSTASLVSSSGTQWYPALDNNISEDEVQKPTSNEILDGPQSSSTEVEKVEKPTSHENVGASTSATNNVETARKSGSIKMARVSGVTDASNPRRSGTTVSTRRLLEGLLTPDEVPTGIPRHNIATTKASSIESRPTFSRPQDIPTLINEAHYATDKEQFAAQDHCNKLRSQLLTAAKRQQQYRAAADVMAFHRFDWGAEYWEELGLGRRMPNQRNHGKPFWMEGTHFESTHGGETESSRSTSQSGSRRTRYEDHYPCRHTDLGRTSMHRSGHRSGSRPLHSSRHMRERLPSIPEDACFDMNRWLSGESPYHKSRRPVSERKAHSEPERRAASDHLERRMSAKSRGKQRCTKPESLHSSNKASTATSPSVYSRVDGEDAKDEYAGSDCPRLKTLTFSSLGSVRTMKPSMYADETKQQSLASALGANIPHRSWADGNGLGNGTARALDARRERRDAHLRQKELCTKYSNLVMASASR